MSQIRKAIQECEGIILSLTGVLKTVGLYPAYAESKLPWGYSEWCISWYDEDGYRNSLSCWDDNGEGIWSKYKNGSDSDKFEFNVTTDNEEDIMIRILTGEEK